MDPNAVLTNLRKAINNWCTEDRIEDRDGTDAAAQAIDAAAALDKWLIAGGFLPMAWAKPIDKVAVTIYISGGALQGVYASTPEVYVTLFDADDKESEGMWNEEIDAELAAQINDLYPVY